MILWYLFVRDLSIVEMKKKMGWQYLVIRSSFITHVIANNAELLECCLQESLRDRMLMINLLDEYNGYCALHYATILCHTECMDVLLENGANYKIEDRNGRSAMYHALRQRNDKVADVLEKYGADRNSDLRQVIIDEIQEQENEASKSATANNDESNDDDVDMSYSDRSSNSVNEALIDAARRFG
jgi:ankyrin repeat protein